MQIIEITQEDLDNYFLSLSNKGVIRQARIKIFGSMPSYIRSEFQTRINDLVCTDDIGGIYEIVAQKASDDLKNFLKKYQFHLKNKSQQVQNVND